MKVFPVLNTSTQIEHFSASKTLPPSFKFENNPMHVERKNFQCNEKLPKNVETIAQLEKSIGFLKSEHDWMLQALHQEVHNLKLQNTDLQLQLATQMAQPATMAPETHHVELEMVKQKNKLLSELLTTEQRKVASLSKQHKSITKDVGVQASPDSAEKQSHYQKPLALKPHHEDDASSKEQEMLQRSKNLKLKYRGCNHPMRLVHRSQPIKLGNEDKAWPLTRFSFNAQSGHSFPALQSQKITPSQRQKSPRRKTVLPPVQSSL